MYETRSIIPKFAGPTMARPCKQFFLKLQPSTLKAGCFKHNWLETITSGIYQRKQWILPPFSRLHFFSLLYLIFNYWHNSFSYLSYFTLLFVSFFKLLPWDSLPPPILHILPQHPKNVAIAPRGQYRPPWEPLVQRYRVHTQLEPIVFVYCFVLFYEKKLILKYTACVVCGRKKHFVVFNTKIYCWNGLWATYLPAYLSV